MVAVIGDGALTGGMAWEALNNIAVAKDSRLVIVVNDNGRSYQPTIGGLANHLASVRVDPALRARAGLHQDHPVAHPGGRAAAVRRRCTAMKKGLKDVLQPQVLFEDLGLKYLGPDRRPRRADAWSTRCAGPATSAARCSCT